MPWLAAVAGAGGQIGSALIAANSASDARDQAARLAQESISQLESAGIPTIEAQQLVLEKYRSAGQLTPELEQAISQGPSQMENISTDPREKEAQMQALQQLSDIGQGGGMRLSDQAVANKALGDIQAQERGSREAIAQDLREKSRYGGGDELAMKLANQQNAATAENQVGLQQAGSAQDRALQAILQSGQLGGQMQGQEFNQKAQQAAAADAIARFNAQNSQEVQQRNIAAKNNAQASNLSNAQNIQNANVDMANKQQMYNKSLYQQQYENQLQKAGMAANARAGQASNIMDAGKQTAAAATAAGKGIGQAGTSIAQYYTQPEKTKQTYSVPQDEEQQ